MMLWGGESPPSSLSLCHPTPLLLAALFGHVIAAIAGGEREGMGEGWTNSFFSSPRKERFGLLKVEVRGKPVLRGLNSIAHL